MPNLPKTFVTDHLVRDVSGRPTGRIVLASDYEEGKDIAVAVMDVSATDKKALAGMVFYIDGNQYKVPEDLPDLRFTKTSGKLLINNFYLRKV